MQFFADGLAELLAPLGGAVSVLVQVLEALLPLLDREKFRNLQA